MTRYITGSVVSSQGSKVLKIVQYIQNRLSLHLQNNLILCCLVNLYPLSISPNDPYNTVLAESLQATRSSHAKVELNAFQMRALYAPS